jgi:hypothetical protein
VGAATSRVRNRTWALVACVLFCVLMSLEPAEAVKVTVSGGFSIFEREAESGAIQYGVRTGWNALDPWTPGNYSQCATVTVGAGAHGWYQVLPTSGTLYTFGNGEQFRMPPASALAVSSVAGTVAVSATGSRVDVGSVLSTVPVAFDGGFGSGSAVSTVSLDASSTIGLGAGELGNAVLLVVGVAGAGLATLTRTWWAG